VEAENSWEQARPRMGMHGMRKEQLEELGQRGRACYLVHLSMGIAGQRMEEIFRKVVAGPYGGRKESTPTGQITAREKGDSGASGELPDSDTGPTVAEPISSRK